MFQQKIIKVTPIRQNCSLIWDDATMRGAVVDPGGDLPLIEAAIKETGVKVEKIFVTHGHFDHAGAVAPLALATGATVEGPNIGDKELIDGFAQQSQGKGFRVSFGFIPEAVPFTPDRWLNDGDTVTFGNMSMRVLYVPGHTQGHVAFFLEQERFAFVGDVLFAGAVGRTDHAGGNHAQLIESITKKLLPLGDDVRIQPGHGRQTTIGKERLTNPWIGMECRNCQGGILIK